jgi:hypothetical protein
MNARIFALLLTCAALGAAACRGSAPEETTAPDMSKDAAPAPSSSNSFTDLTKRLSQKQTPPPVDPDAAAPVAKREPDWDLDHRDPARDYVRRYVWGVARYGDLSACVDAQPSVPRNGKAEVHVADAVPPHCPPTGVDETFAVDVPGDRLELVRQQVDRTKLRPWLDGSDPGAPAKAKVPEFAEPNKWNTPTGKAMKDARLVPIRIQLYGRGTYPFVMLAGWPPWFPRTMDQASRDAFAAQICSGSQGMPLAIGAGLDRSNVLRVRCGDSPTAVWDVL